MAPSTRIVQYSIDRLPDGDRLVRSVGLSRVGQHEICVRVSHHRRHNIDHQVMGVMNFIGDYVLETGARIKPGESLEYGWTLLQFVERAPSLLEVHEIADPFSEQAEPPVVPGIDRALQLADASRDVMKRNGLTGRSDFPYRGKTAVTCTHFRSAPEHQLYMERTEALDSRDSGWSITCNDKPHETADLMTEHLAHVGAHRRFVVPYLTVPTGTAVAFDTAGAIVFPTGRDTGRRDPSDPYLLENWDFAG